MLRALERAPELARLGRERVAGLSWERTAARDRGGLSRSSSRERASIVVLSVDEADAAATLPAADVAERRTSPRRRQRLHRRDGRGRRGATARGCCGSRSGASYAAAINAAIGRRPAATRCCCSTPTASSSRASSRRCARRWTPTRAVGAVAPQAAARPTARALDAAGIVDRPPAQERPGRPRCARRLLPAPGARVRRRRRGGAVAPRRARGLRGRRRGARRGHGAVGDRVRPRLARAAARLALRLRAAARSLATSAPTRPSTPRATLAAEHRRLQFRNRLLMVLQERDAGGPARDLPWIAGLRAGRARASRCCASATCWAPTATSGALRPRPRAGAARSCRRGGGCAGPPFGLAPPA